MYIYNIDTYNPIYTKRAQKKKKIKENKKEENTESKLPGEH